MDYNHMNPDAIITEYKQIAKRVGEIQARWKYTNARMACCLNVTKDYYQKRLKTGKTPFTMEKLILLKECGFDLCYIITGKHSFEVQTMGPHETERTTERLLACLLSYPEIERNRTVKGIITELLNLIH